MVIDVRLIEENSTDYSIYGANRRIYLNILSIKTDLKNIKTDIWKSIGDYISYEKNCLINSN